MTDGLPGTTAERLQIPDLHKRARTQRLLWAVGVLAAIAATLFALRKRAEPTAELYRTVRVAHRDVVRVVEATGHLDARARYEVPAPFAGRLSAVLVREGDRVRRGQLLARLDDRAGAFAVQNANAEKQAATWHMAEARSALDAANEEQKRVERLAARGLASDQELATARSSAARAKATLEATRAEQGAADSQLASARYTHMSGEIVSPADGVVLVAPENLGSAVTPERALFAIGDPLELMRVDVDVGEGDIGEVRVGQQTTFEVQTYPGRKFTAQVERIGVEPRRDAGVVTYPVRLLAQNPDHALLPGMTAAVKIEVGHASHVLTVRDAALRFTPPADAPGPPRARLWKRVGTARLVEVPVKAGLSDGMYTEVKPLEPSALSDGDEVAVGFVRPDSGGRNQPGISLGGR